MNEVFDIILATRTLTITPDDMDHLQNGFVVGCFDIAEGDTSLGSICFTETAWEYDETGNLTVAEVEAIADEIIFFYKQDELEGGYVEYEDHAIKIFNEDEDLIALIELKNDRWVQTKGEKLSDETVLAYVKGNEDFK